MGDDALTAGELGRALDRIESAVSAVQADVRDMLGRLERGDVHLDTHERRLAALEVWQSRIMWTVASIGVTAAGALITAAVGVMLRR